MALRNSEKYWTQNLKHLQGEDNTKSANVPLACSYYIGIACAFAQHFQEISNST